MNFINNLFSDSATVSSKRFIALVSLLMFCICIVSQVFFSKTVPNELYYSLIALITGSSAMTLKTNNASGSAEISNKE